eukprot:1006438-Prymnesium_polylepis.1
MRSSRRWWPQRRRRSLRRPPGRSQGRLRPRLAARRAGAAAGALSCAHEATSMPSAAVRTGRGRRRRPVTSGPRGHDRQGKLREL